jgi:preprotein translocase subunit SecD
MSWGTRALAGATGLGLLVAACSLDTGGPAGILTTAQLAYVGKAPSESGRKQLVDVVEERLAAVGVTRSEIEVEDEGLVVEVGDYPEGELDRAWAVATRIGRLRIRPLISLRDGSRNDITSTDDDVAAEPVVLQQADPAGAVVTYELGPAVGPDHIGTVAGTTVAEGRWGVTLDLADDAHSAFVALAEACRAKQPLCPTGRVAFVVDSVVIDVLDQAALRAASGDEPVELFGGLAETSARDLATVLQSGPLPVALELGKVRTEP